MEPNEIPQTTVRARLEARRRRISLIRRRVAATALTIFALAFGVIWQTGPLGGAVTAAVSPTPTAAVTSVAQSTPAASSSHDATYGSNQGTGLTPVTTSQS